MPRITLGCVVVLESAHMGRERVHRWSCEPCNKRGEWTTSEKANAEGQTHVLSATNMKESI